MQRKMPLMGEAYEAAPKMVPQQEIELCETLDDAIRLCVQRSQYRKHYQIADLMDMSPSHFSKCLGPSHHFPPEKLEELEETCGNLAITQYWCWRRGIEMPESEHDRHIRELEEQAREAQERLEEAKKRVAA